MQIGFGTPQGRAGGVARLGAHLRVGGDRSVLLLALSRRLSIGERAVRLTPLELAFVSLLRRRGGRMVRRTVMCLALWGSRGESYDRRLDLLVKRLRDKLGADHGLIQTVAGLGHRLCVRAGMATVAGSAGLREDDNGRE